MNEFYASWMQREIRLAGCELSLGKLFCPKKLSLGKIFDQKKLSLGKLFGQKN